MSAQPSAEPDHRAPLPVTEVPPSNLPVAGTAPTPPDKTRMKTISGQAAADAPASAVPLAEPIAAAPSVRPGTQPLPSATPAPEPVIAHGEDPASRPAETAAVSQPAAAPLDAGKILKHDPRIDLQALVWAPESAARFVVINNRLIKEGGSVDNIVVVRINPDDVLLAEGSDQWHEPFTIR
jgi:hypothetical protein